MQEILEILPDHIRHLLSTLKPSVSEELEEIRIRVARPLEVICAGRPYYPFLNNDYYIVKSSDATYVLSQLSQYSIYAFEEELKRGFITIKGGHRVGLAGKVVLDH